MNIKKISFLYLIVSLIISIVGGIVGSSLFLFLGLINLCVSFYLSDKFFPSSDGEFLLTRFFSFFGLSADRAEELSLSIKNIAHRYALPLLSLVWFFQTIQGVLLRDLISPSWLTITLCLFFLSIALYPYIKDDGFVIGEYSITNQDFPFLGGVVSLLAMFQFSGRFSLSGSSLRIWAGLVGLTVAFCLSLIGGKNGTRFFSRVTHKFLGLFLLATLLRGCFGYVTSFLSSRTIEKITVKELIIDTPETLQKISELEAEIEILRNSGGEEAAYENDENQHLGGNSGNSADKTSLLEDSQGDLLRGEEQFDELDQIEQKKRTILRRIDRESDL